MLIMLATEPLLQNEPVISGNKVLHNLPHLYYKNESATVFNSDCLALLPLLPNDFANLIFADPPYHLSNGGFTCKNGRQIVKNIAQLCLKKRGSSEPKNPL